MDKRIIKKINVNKSNMQLTVTVPKESGFKPGDYVELFTVPEQDVKKLRGKKE